MQTNIYSHKLPNQEKWIRLTVKEANCLFAFYVFMLILSSGWLFYSLIYHFDLSENGFSIILGILMFSCSGGLLGSTIYYIRKLYKSCIQNLVTDSKSNPDNTEHRKAGTKMYFYIRPFIGMVLSVIINLGVIGGFYIIGNQPDLNNNRFFLFVLLLSFYIGFCNGKVLVNINKHGNDIIDYIFKEENNSEK